MTRFSLLFLFLGCAIAADRNTIIPDPAVSRAFKERYVKLTDSWAQGIEFTPAETAAMQAGKKWEEQMMAGPGDPLAKGILAAGEPSFDALAADYPGPILDRTILGT